MLDGRLLGSWVMLLGDRCVCVLLGRLKMYLVSNLLLDGLRLMHLMMILSLLKWLAGLSLQRIGRSGWWLLVLRLKQDLSLLLVLLLDRLRLMLLYARGL